MSDCGCGYDSTVAAISTPYGRGGVAVIRVTGKDAVEITDRIFRAASGKKLCDTPERFAVYGTVVSGGELIDEAVVTVFRAPRSYTGENTAEISTHGGILVSGRVLRAVFEAGAEPAGPGEFTKRAFVNGKLSLSQAEAVINVIDAETSAALSLALSHVGGALTAVIDGIYNELLALVSQAYVYADYPDEDLTDVTDAQLEEALLRVSGKLSDLYAGYKTGHAVSEGIFCAIVGKPNAGKSTLLNLILGKNRAIVSDIPGTTRDSVEDTAVVGDIILRLCDTAGIRESDDRVERLGIERSLEALGKAELVLAVFDGSEPASAEDRRVLEAVEKSNASKIAVINKSELVQKFDIDLNGFDDIIRMSARLPGNDSGADRLLRAIEGLFVTGKIDYSSKTQTLLTNARQAAAVKAASDALERAIEAKRAGYTRDVVCLDLEDAMARLAETDGRAVSADIVDNIFHRFCVGK